MENHPLDNACWYALGSRHRHLAEERGRARRYRPDVSVFAALDGLDEESWADLGALVGPSQTTVVSRAEMPPGLARGWTERRRGRGIQMTVDPQKEADVEPVALRRLTVDDVPAMLELVALTVPGPFLAGTIEMGAYYGHFDGGRLLSMAGERLSLDGFTEISAVCTHPDVRGRGLASALTTHVAAAIAGRGEQPFLHVAESNESARRLYRGLGFVERRAVDLVVLQSPPA